MKLDNVQEGYADRECFGIKPVFIVFKVSKVNVIKMIPESYDHISSTWRDEMRLRSSANVVDQVSVVNKVKKAHKVQRVVSVIAVKLVCLVQMVKTMIWVQWVHLVFLDHVVSLENLAQRCERGLNLVKLVSSERRVAKTEDEVDGGALGL